MPATAEASHRVDFLGDKAVIRDVGLFCGLDPEIDRPGGRMDRYDRKRVDEVFEFTKTLAARGQLPRVIEGHNDGSEKRSVGRISQFWREDRGDVPYIRGDIEVSRDFFEREIATNKLPRRSAEINRDDGQMEQIALLGSEAPARPVEDTNFAKANRFALPERDCFSKDCFQMSAPDGGNTFTPTADDAPPKKKKKKESDMDDDKGLRDQCAKLEETCDRFAKELKARDAEREDFNKQLASMRDQLATSECERLVEQFEKSGPYALGASRSALVAELRTATDRKAKLELWSKLFAKAPIDLRIAGGHFETEAGATPPTVESFNKIVSDASASVQGKRGDAIAAAAREAFAKAQGRKTA